MDRELQTDAEAHWQMPTGLKTTVALAACVGMVGERDSAEDRGERQASSRRSMTYMHGRLGGQNALGEAGLLQAARGSVGRDINVTAGHDEDGQKSAV